MYELKASHYHSWHQPECEVKLVYQAAHTSEGKDAGAVATLVDFASLHHKPPHPLPAWLLWVTLLRHIPCASVFRDSCTGPCCTQTTKFTIRLGKWKGREILGAHEPKDISPLTPPLTLGQMWLLCLRLNSPSLKAMRLSFGQYFHSSELMTMAHPQVSRDFWQGVQAANKRIMFKMTNNACETWGWKGLLTVPRLTPFLFLLTSFSTRCELIARQRRNLSNLGNRNTY